MRDVPNIIIGVVILAVIRLTGYSLLEIMITTYLLVGITFLKL